MRPDKRFGIPPVANHLGADTRFGGALLMSGAVHGPNLIRSAIQTAGKPAVTPSAPIVTDDVKTQIIAAGDARKNTLHIARFFFPR